MGNVIGTCGHDITDEDMNDVGISIMERSRRGERCVAHCAACKDCREFYHNAGIVLESEEMQRQWFDGEIDYPSLNTSQDEEKCLTCHEYDCRCADYDIGY